MIQHEAKNVHEDSGMEFLPMEMLALTPLRSDESFPDAFPMPLFALADDDEDDMEEDDFDDEEDFDDDEEDFDDDDEDDDDEDDDFDEDEDEDFDYDEDDDFEYDEE